MVFPKNALMCMNVCINVCKVYNNKKKKLKLMNHDCLPIFKLYPMLTYLMLLAALSNAVCLYNAIFSCY